MRSSRRLLPGESILPTSPKEGRQRLLRCDHMGGGLALEQPCPQVVAGSVDDRLQMMVHGDQLGGGTAVGLRLRWQRLPEHHLEALGKKRALSCTIVLNGPHWSQRQKLTVFPAWLSRNTRTKQSVNFWLRTA